MPSSKVYKKMVPDLLFCKGNLREFLEKSKASAIHELESQDPNYVLNVSEEDFCKYLVSKYSLKSPVLNEDKIYVHGHNEVDIDVSQDPLRAVFDRSRPFHIKGTQVTIAIPFEGDPELFEYQSSSFTFNPPRGEILEQEIHLVYQTTEHKPENLKSEYTRELGEIKRYLEWVRNDVENFNKSLEPFIRQAFEKRKEKLLADQGLVSALGIPIKKRQDLPETYSIPTVRKKTRISKPQATIEPFKPEPSLAEEEYENILEIIQNMAVAMERSPKTFSKLQEEEVRDHFLLHLNGHYEGQATGETFNFGGKTDILIREEGKNVFISECKIWRGKKSLIGATDQLLAYTSWRDTKTAILIFNKDRNFSTVLQQIDSIMKSHPCYKRENTLNKVSLNNETTYSYIFHHPGDPNRELILTIIAFDIPPDK